MRMRVSWPCMLVSSWCEANALRAVPWDFSQQMHWAVAHGHMDTCMYAMHQGGCNTCVHHASKLLCRDPGEWREPALYQENFHTLDVRTVTLWLFNKIYAHACVGACFFIGWVGLGSSIALKLILPQYSVHSADCICMQRMRCEYLLHHARFCRCHVPCICMPNRVTSTVRVCLLETLLW